MSNHLVQSPTRNVGSFISDYQGQSIRIQRLEQMTQAPLVESLLVDRPISLRNDPPALTLPARNAGAALRTLDVTGLSYRHPSFGRGVEDVHLHLQQGDFVVITGRVGAGKTTLLRSLLGLLPNDAGEIRWDGEVVPDPPASSHRPWPRTRPKCPGSTPSLWPITFVWDCQWMKACSTLPSTRLCWNQTWRRWKTGWIR